MGFSQKIQVVNGAVPSQLNFQQYYKRQLCCAAACSSREVFTKRQGKNIIEERIEEIYRHVKDLCTDDDNMIQKLLIYSFNNYQKMYKTKRQVLTKL